MGGDPQNVRFGDACKVANHYFGEPRQRGTSHRVWKMPWPGNPRVNMQDDGGKAKRYQVEQLVAAIDHLKGQIAKHAQETEAKDTETTRAKKGSRKKRKQAKRS